MKKCQIPYSLYSLREAIKKLLSNNNSNYRCEFVDIMATPELVNYTCAEIFVKELYNNKAFKLECAMVKQAYLDIHTNGMFNYN